MWREIVHTFGEPGRVDADFGDEVVSTSHPSAEERGKVPTEPWRIFLASIGTCVASFVEHYLRSRGLSLEGVSIVQRQDFAEDDDVLPEIRIRIRLPDDFPEEHRAPLIEAAGSCTVKRVMEAAPRFVIEAGPAADE